MSIPINSIFEITEALKYVSIVKINLEKSKNWGAFPIQSIGDNSVDIIIKLKENDIFALEGDKVILKFQSNGYEFHIEANIKSVTDFDLVIIDLIGFRGIKYLNVRKHIRFDMQLKAMIQMVDTEIDASVKNISMGGALISTRALEIGSYYDLKIIFDDDNVFSTKAKILREVKNDKSFEYGVKFEELTSKNSNILSREILKYEKRSLDSFKVMKGTNYNYCDKKINILNYNKFENVDIRDTLIKIGAGNYEVLYNFKYYINFFISEKPDILIVDTESVNDNIRELVVNVRENFKNISIIMLVPYEMEKSCSNNSVFNGIKLLYRPLVYNEFEDVIIKYL